MLAAQITRFGDPDVLELHEVARPEPGTGEVQVAVEAASVNGHDTIVRSGGLKVVSGRRFPLGVGLDFVGTVSALGTGVGGYAVGDRVWGTVHPQRKHVVAAAAEFVVVTADRISRAPQSSAPAEAVALVVAGATALVAFEELGLRPGRRLLVRGAAGGVGSAAVQLAHALGAHVTAVVGSPHVDAVRALGADDVLDRRSATPDSAGAYDAVLDVAGTQLTAWRRTVARGGRMVTIALSGPVVLAAGLSTVHGGRRIRAFSANPTTPVLQALAEHVDAGALRPVIASTRPLAEVADAHRAFERGGALGKHVLTVAS